MKAENYTNIDKQFYPTPRSVANKMLSKLNNKVTTYRHVLEPSAGKGDLIKSFNSNVDLYLYRGTTFHCCEIDKNLQSILKDIDNVKIVGSDFLEFDSIETYDLVLMNPPFIDGDKHLLKAIDYVINGDILCILNAETLKNPYSNIRKTLVQKLDALGAEIEFITAAFENAERKTDVEIAIVHITKKCDFENVFGEEYEKENLVIDFTDGTEVKDINKNQSVNELIDEYKDYQKRIVRTIHTMFEASCGCRELFSITIDNDSLKNSFSMGQMPSALRCANEIIKRKYWGKLLDRDEFKRKLTSKQESNFHLIIRKFSDMEFSVDNVNILYEYLLDKGPKLFENAIFSLFDEITQDHSWYPEQKRNIYLFSGWKSNNGYKINKKFILIKRCYAERFSSTWGVSKYLEDIEKVFVYFNNGIYPELKLSDAFEEWEKDKSTTNVFENSMFKVTAYKKGTMHFVVKDDALLRRFNVFVSKKRNWLPPDYATKTYKTSTEQEKEIIKSFEGEKEYSKNLGDPFLINESSNFIRIE